VLDCSNVNGTVIFTEGFLECGTLIKALLAGCFVTNSRYLDLSMFG